jgi:site-specific recombinase XerD
MVEPVRLPIEGADDPWHGLWESFERHLRAEGRDPKTVVAYRRAGRDFHEWAHEHHVPCDPAQVRHEHIEALLIDLREVREAKPATIRLRFAALHRFFDYAVGEDEIDRSPMARLKAPRVEEEPPSVLAEEELSALLRACSGRSFTDRRDTALIRMLVDTGLRREELLSIHLDALDLSGQSVRVIGKGNRPRLAFFGAKTARDLDRYLRVRARHTKASSPHLWLPPSGTASRSATTGCARCSIDAREKPGSSARCGRMGCGTTSRTRCKEAGATDEDTMTLGGWRDPKIMRRYGASMAQARRGRRYHARSEGSPTYTSIKSSNASRGPTRPTLTVPS